MKPSRIIGITIAITIFINFFATPYVFNGFFMKDVFDDITLVLVVVLGLELNLLGVKEFPKNQRIMLFVLTIIYIVTLYFGDIRMMFNGVILWAIPMGVFLTKDYLKNYKPKKKEMPRNRMFVTLLMSLLLIVGFISGIEVLDDSGLWIIMLVVGVVSGILSFIVSYRLKHKTSEIAIFSLSGLIMIPLMLYVLIIGLNYSLDQSEPEVYKYKIVELDVRTSRSNTSYEAYFIMNGEEQHVEVGKDEYYELEVGDMIEISRYKGLFGIEYIVNE